MQDVRNSVAVQKLNETVQLQNGQPSARSHRSKTQYSRFLMHQFRKSSQKMNVNSKEIKVEDLDATDETIMID